MELKIKGIEFAFRWCPAGTFQMGSPASETGRIYDETQHGVTLTKGFWIGETVVTQEQWKAVMGGLKYADGEDLEGYFLVDGEPEIAKLKDRSSFLDDKKPAVCVSRDDCQKFIEKLNSLAGDELSRLAGGSTNPRLKFALPTEAQWEYACRAGSTTTYCFGNDEDKLIDYAVYSGLRAEEWSIDKIRDKHTEPVKSKKPNQWNLYDMHGNVWEWCSDWYGDYLAAGDVNHRTEPVGANTGSYRVYRGGSWNSFAENCRSAYRLDDTPGNRDSGLGFRLSLVSE